MPQIVEGLPHSVAHSATRPSAKIASQSPSRVERLQDINQRSLAAARDRLELGEKPSFLRLLTVHV